MNASALDELAVMLTKASNMLHGAAHPPSTRQCVPRRCLLTDPRRGFRQGPPLCRRVRQAAHRPRKRPEGAAAAPLAERAAAPRRLPPHIVPRPWRILTLPACRLVLLNLCWMFMLGQEFRICIDLLTCNILTLFSHFYEAFIWSVGPDNGPGC